MARFPLIVFGPDAGLAPVATNFNSLEEVILAISKFVRDPISNNFFEVTHPLNNERCYISSYALEFISMIAWGEQVSPQKQSVIPVRAMPGGPLAS